MKGLRRYNFYVDLDGVMADFDSGFLEYTGSTIAMHEHPDEDHAWSLIKRTPNFWLRLKPLPGAINFWEALRPYSPSVLTSPSSHDTDRAILEKRAWVDKWLGKHVNIYFRRASQKAQFAAPDAILIDDWENNILAWKAKGGLAIHHMSIQSTLAQLKEIESSDHNVHAFLTRNFTV